MLRLPQILQSVSQENCRTLEELWNSIKPAEGNNEYSEAFIHSVVKGHIHVNNALPPGIRVGQMISAEDPYGKTIKITIDDGRVFIYDKDHDTLSPSMPRLPMRYSALLRRSKVAQTTRLLWQSCTLPMSLVLIFLQLRVHIQRLESE